MTHAKLQTLAQNGLSQAGETARETRAQKFSAEIATDSRYQFLVCYAVEHSHVCVSYINQH